MHMCIYVTTYELNMLRHCTAAQVLLSVNMTVQSHIQILKYNQPLINLKFPIATKCKNNKKTCMGMGG